MKFNKNEIIATIEAMLHTTTINNNDGVTEYLNKTGKVVKAIYTDLFNMTLYYKYDTNNNLIFKFDTDNVIEEVYEYINDTISHLITNDFEEWYDTEGRTVHYKDDSVEEWYDKNGHIIHEIDERNIERWYDMEGRVIHAKSDTIEEEYIYIKNKKCTTRRKYSENCTTGEWRGMDKVSVFVIFFEITHIIPP